MPEVNGFAFLHTCEVMSDSLGLQTLMAPQIAETPSWISLTYLATWRQYHASDDSDSVCNNYSWFFTAHLKQTESSLSSLPQGMKL
jgi:hypothetical protein